MENSTPAKNYAEMTFHLKGKQIPTSRESIFIQGLSYEGFHIIDAYVIYFSKAEIRFWIWAHLKMSSDFNFTVASWFARNVHVKPNLNFLQYTLTPTQ